jgi:hypothetical protein
MPDEPHPIAIHSRPPLGRLQQITRVGIPAVVLGIMTAAFGYFGGWLTPHDLAPGKCVDAFQAVDGTHVGFRRNHAKGVCSSGSLSNSDVRHGPSTVYPAAQCAALLVAPQNAFGISLCLFPYVSWPFHRRAVSYVSCARSITPSHAPVECVTT